MKHTCNDMVINHLRVLYGIYFTKVHMILWCPASGRKINTLKGARTTIKFAGNLQIAEIVRRQFHL